MTLIPKKPSELDDEYTDAQPNDWYVVDRGGMPGKQRRLLDRLLNNPNADPAGRIHLKQLDTGDIVLSYNVDPLTDALDVAGESAFKLSISGTGGSDSFRLERMAAGDVWGDAVVRLEVGEQVIITGLPTVDPAVAGALYVTAGAVKISAG